MGRFYASSQKVRKWEMVTNIGSIPMAAMPCGLPTADALGNFHRGRSQRELTLDGKIHGLYPGCHILWDANEAVRS
jgi:hypothetical protein